MLSEFHTGLHFAGAKIVAVSRILAEEHYEEHRGKFFYESLQEYITGASTIPRTLEAQDYRLCLSGPGPSRRSGTSPPHQCP
jgi:nucleoside-diphosphate kinase